MTGFRHPPVTPETPAEQAAHDASVIAWAATCGTSAWCNATAGEWADYVLFLFRQQMDAERARLGLEAGPARLPSAN